MSNTLPADRPTAPRSLPDEHNLLVAFRQGNRRAFEQLYVAHATALFAYGKRLCSDHQLVADTIQDVFLDIWVQRDTVENILTLRFYLFRMLRNKLARASRNKTAFLPDERTETPQILTESSAEQAIIKQETESHQHQRVQQAVAQLPNRQREAVMLAFYHDFSNDQIAGIMGISHQSVTNHLNRAFKSLRDVITFINMAGILLAFCA